MSPKMKRWGWDCPLCRDHVMYAHQRVEHLVHTHHWVWPKTWTKRTLKSFWGSVPDHPGRKEV